MAESTKKKSDTYEEILKNAKAEFLQHGFEKASMRSIAAMTGITAGALYKHFPSNIGTNFSEIAIKLYEAKNPRAIKEAIRISLQNLCTLVYTNFDDFRLLFNRSAGTKHENISHEFVMADVVACKKLIANLKKRGANIRTLNEEQLYLIYSTALTPLFEIITHEYSYKKAISFMDILTDVMYFCWNQIMQPETESHK